MTHRGRSSFTEADIIRKIQQTVARNNAAGRVVLSIGDDAAAFRPRPNRLILVSCDALVEGIHFNLAYSSPEDVGWKALAVNLSDIAAMGGKPLYATTSIALPKNLAAGFVVAMYRGLAKLARQHGVIVVGGDTCASTQHLFIDVTIVGEVESKKMLTRKGARPGDLLFVTGELGGAALGLERLSRQQGTRRSALVRRHLRPQPRCSAGRFIADSRLASAMIDTSDGLSTDLHHLCEQSGAGAEVQAENIPLPVVAAGRRQARTARRLLDYALNGGEDYELLFTVPEHRKHRVPQSVGGIPIREIGKITAETGACWICVGGSKERLVPGGYDHFRR